MLKTTLISLISAIILTCSGCRSSHDDTSHPVMQGDNSIYYWRTTFTLSQAERKFLKVHDITKIYLHLFDVIEKRNQQGKEQVIPGATIKFVDSIPADIDYVPTIYITNFAMREMANAEETYALKIWKRINAICNKNGIPFHEIQLDCDWTESTRDGFFKLCESMKQCMDSTQVLSSTIRLHQLTQTPPPVDKGVLMVYNTGNMMELSTTNSIFSRVDIEPYLKDNRLKDYQLPLDVAYPTYGWSLVYEPRATGEYIFSRILKMDDFTSYPDIKLIGKNLYNVTKGVDFTPDTDHWNVVYKNSHIRVERPSVGEILQVKKMIDSRLSDKPHSNIIYHLDEKQLSHYNDNEIDNIYIH